MSPSNKLLSCILYGAGALAAAGFAAAQESPAAAAAPSAADAPTPAKSKASKSTAQIDAGEPRATTSQPAPGTTSDTASSAGGTAPAAAKPVSGSSSETRPPKAAGQKGPGGVDRLELNTATVTGDREQPKVMYIVPWKSSDIGDLSGKPMNSLLDEALAPVDRDEFKREVAYYDVVKADRSQNGTSSGTAKQGEK